MCISVKMKPRGQKPILTWERARHRKTYYEYDYNEIIGPTNNLPLDGIQAHPEQYLNYKYTENKTDADSLIKRIEKLEQVRNSTKKPR